MLLQFNRKTAVCFCWALFFTLPVAVIGQSTYYTTNGTEYPVVGSLPGDQVLPDVAVTTAGGFVVWQDNITDGTGWGVSARRLDSTLSGTLSTFRVNVQGANDQQNPRVAMLKNGGAVFVWQGGKPSNEHIYARFLTPTNTFITTNDILVNTFTNNFQINPAVATLASGNVVIVWGSFDQANANSLQDVYGQMFSPTGQKIGSEFLINQFTTYNQRTPSVAALAGDGFVVAWVSEQESIVGVPNGNAVAPNQQAYPSIDIYARLYTVAGTNAVASGNEFLVNTDSNPCAHPGVAAGTDGGFMVAWDAHDMNSPRANSLDIRARSFTSAGAGSGSAVVRVNTYLYGDQYAPRISPLGTDYLVTWTSLAQDGSREGVYGQFLRGDGSEFGVEFRVNTTTVSSQMQPAVASDGVNQFLVVWTSYIGAPYSFDLYAQRYLNVAAALQPMAAPFVYAPFVVVSNRYQPQLRVSWPLVIGLSVSNYEVYVDSVTTPTAVTASNVWVMTATNGLTADSTHSFYVDYVTTDGRRSPISPPASGTTWGSCNYMNSGVPCDWIAEMYPSSPWPSNVNAPIVPGGPTVYQVFLSGGNPLDPNTWLQTTLANTQQGLYLSWNTQPGLTYQVQVTTNFTAWTNLGGPRFAADYSDSIYVGGSSAGYYRVQLLYH